MRILITGSLVFLLWAVFAGWLYVSSIKPAFTPVAEQATTPDSTALQVSQPVAAELPKPEMLVLYFDFSKADIKENSENDQHFKLFTEWLSNHPDAALSITGHTDNRGSVAYNLELGSKRAENTKKYLEAKGVPSQKISTLSGGESQPAADNSSADGRAKNRRSEITLK
jgi:outer membrane protein OmpA-like peptidoglycan-associated protein